MVPSPRRRGEEEEEEEEAEEKEEKCLRVLDPTLSAVTTAGIHRHCTSLTSREPGDFFICPRFLPPSDPSV